jgi:long-chain acyl-CoA synthetase
VQRVSATDIWREIGDDTLASAFARTVQEHGPRVALRAEGPDGWRTMSYAAYGDRAARVATGLHELGVRPGDRVVLMLRNVPEFHVVDMACVLCGATPVSLYNSSPPEQIAYLVGHSAAVLAVVEGEETLGRFAAVRDRMPTLRSIITVGPAGADATVADLAAADPVDLGAAAAAIRPDDLATIIYTSGTTGPPKGVALTHGQLRFTTESLRLALGWSREDLLGKRGISYLPMAHIAERMSSHYNAILSAYEITTCPDLSLLGAYLREIRPNIMFGVPRVWEKLHAGVTASLTGDPDRRAKFDDAVAAALPIERARTWGTATPEQEETWRFLDAVAFAPIRQAIGLDELDFAVTGAAPITADLLGWFRAIGVPLSEIYGLSETCGPLCWEPHRVKPGTVGPPIPGSEVRLAPDGEIVCRGGNIFGGYLDDPERSAEVLDDDGWLHTGDIGAVDDDGYVRIVDRKKEMIITAGGTNVSPANLEASLKLVPLVGQACAVGDGRPFVTALLVLDPDQARAFAAAEGIEHGSLADLAAHPKVHAAVAAGVDEAMARFGRAERVRKFAILGDEWLPDSDELTPTSKLRRRSIHQRYRDRIEALYG